MIPVPTILRNTAFGLAILAASLVPAAAETPLEQAVQLYDAGRYADAKPLLEQVVAGGDAGGVTHYRLYFCQRATNDPAQQATLEQARELLEQEVREAGGFESAFYLSNTYANLGRQDRVPTFAAGVTSRFEAGEIEAPTTAVEQFRLGKLYADQDRDLDATPWFEKAVDGFSAAPEVAHRPYLDWGARWLGTRAMSDERYEAAARRLVVLLESGKATLAELDNLGLASLMIGDYRQSQKAWARAVRMNPGDADRYRYGSGLAELCRLTKEIPISPDGERGWDELTREELEQTLREQTVTVREAKTEAAGLDPLPPEKRKELNARIAAARPVFVGAALEYMRRGFNLREAAFFGGYAPLVFHAREWQLKAGPKPRRLRARDLVRDPDGSLRTVDEGEKKDGEERP